MKYSAAKALIREVRDKLDELEAYIDTEHKEALRTEQQNEELRKLLPYGTELVVDDILPAATDRPLTWQEQKEVDAAFAKRLAVVRRKWSNTEADHGR